MSAPTALLSQERAEQLFAEIRNGLLNVERSLIEFVTGRGWVLLGYVSFEELWQEKLADVHLATDAMRASVVYALLDEDMTDKEIIAAMDGRVGDDWVSAFRRQRANGVPPHLASTRVRAHRRSRPSQPTDFRIHLHPDERAQWKASIEAHGHSPEEWMLRVLRREIARLEEAGVGR